MTENFRRPFNVCDVPEDARSPPNPVERSMVLSVRDLVLGSGAVVRPCFLWHDLSCDRLCAWLSTWGS